MSNRGYIPPPKPDTPCGYCFEKEATGWDHLIPVSAGGLDNPENLMPSCKRCNSLLSNFIFKTIKAKSAYIYYRLKGQSKNRSLSLVQETIQEKPKASDILQPKMSMGKVGKRSPKDKY